jgi:MT-A70
MSKGALMVYDDACRLLAKAVRVDEVKRIRDSAIAMAAYARQAKNREAEADAVELRMRATRKLGHLIEAQKTTVGLATGGEHGGRRSKDGLRRNPSIARATLSMQGIDKTLAHQGRVLGRLSEPDFKRKVADARGSAARVYRRVVREAEIEQERAERRKQTAQGGTVADLHALIASGYRAGVIATDNPWPFESYSDRAKGAVTDNYETMSLDKIKALPIAQLAADDCALFVWVTWPFMPIWNEVITAWGGFIYSGLGFDWVKLTPDGKDLHWGTGYGTHANPEPCYARAARQPAASR